MEDKEVETRVSELEGIVDALRKYDSSARYFLKTEKPSDKLTLKRVNELIELVNRGTKVLKVIEGFDALSQVKDYLREVKRAHGLAQAYRKGEVLLDVGFYVVTVPREELESWGQAYN